MAEQPTEKTCTKCGETKPLEEFVANKSCRNGRERTCKACASAIRKRRRDANPEADRKRSREYYRANRERLLAYQAEYKKKNPEKVQERNRGRYAKSLERDPEGTREYARKKAREWYHRNPEKAKQVAARYRAANRSTLMERSAQWRNENKHYWWEWAYKRRASAFGFQPVTESFTKADVIAKYGDHCAYCETGEFESLDHYIPVSKGGSHTLENVRPACAGCNSAKNDADPEEWLADQAEFDALTEEEQNALIDAEIARWIDSDDTE